MISELEIKDFFCNQFGNNAVLYSVLEDWEYISNNIEYIPVEYTDSNLKYQYEYLKTRVVQIIDLSIVFKHNSKFVGIWPLSLVFDGTRYKFSTNVGAVLAPIYIKDLSEKLIKKYNKCCMMALLELYKFIKKQAEIECIFWGRHSFLNTAISAQGLLWYRECLEKGATARVENELFLDLSLNLDDIHQKLRKSFRSLIHEGERLWNIQVFDHIDKENFDEFRLLHANVAGRVTRSIDSWNLQFDAINTGHAFIILLHNSAGMLVGGAIFMYSKDEGRYDVGVYDRKLFDKPLGHVVQWAAIKHMKEIGLKWYKIGRRFYPGDFPEPTKKEISISYYKEGFSSEMVLSLVTRNNFKCDNDIY